MADYPRAARLRAPSTTERQFNKRGPAQLASAESANTAPHCQTNTITLASWTCTKRRPKVPSPAAANPPNAIVAFGVSGAPRRNIRAMATAGTAPTRTIMGRQIQSGRSCKPSGPIASHAQARLIAHRDPGIARNDHPHEFVWQTIDAEVDQRHGTERLDDLDAPDTSPSPLGASGAARDTSGTRCRFPG